MTIRDAIKASAAPQTAVPVPVPGVEIDSSKRRAAYQVLR